MIKREDMEEGDKYPVRFFSYGKIKSLPTLREAFVCINAFGFRLFVARGKYDGQNYMIRGEFVRAH